MSTVERRSKSDRRQGSRGGRRAGEVARVGLLGLLLLVAHSSKAHAQAPLQFGFDVASVQAARAQGMPIAYGSIWAGAWNQRWGWGGIEDQLNTAKATGVTPVIQWWYWGDDITPACVENGCYDARQGVQKDKATWTRMSNELADLIVRVMGPGSATIVVIEAEFNKSGIENYEPFDGYLAQHAAIFRGRNLKVGLEFGNWGRSLWTNFDRAVAASDVLGAMALLSSLRDASTYQTATDMLLDAARYYQTTFGKPVFITDFALSSYPEPTYETLQDIEVAEVFARMPEFRAAGVQGLIWRMLKDDPTFDTSNYHGIAERHWGLLRADGSRKAAFSTFLNGMLASADEGPALPAAPSGLTAAAGNAQATLSWSAVGGASGYTVHSSTTSGGPYQAVAVGLPGTSFVHTGLVNAVTYFYVVTAQNAAGVSAPSTQVSVTPAAPVPPPIPAGSIDIWWPKPGVVINGTQPFKALVTGRALSTYKMYWQVGGDKLNVMYNSTVDAPHKEAMVDVTSWTWLGNGPYAITFVAKDNKGKTIATKTTTFTIGR